MMLLAMPIGIHAMLNVVRVSTAISVHLLVRHSESLLPVPR